MPLTPDQVRELYAKRRTKGLYTNFLSELIGSGEQGVSVKEEWPELQDRSASTLKQGFENAKSRKDSPEGSENVDVIVDGENVYLINKAVSGDGASAEAEVAEPAVQ